MYDEPMVTDPAITVAAGDSAAFYPAPVLMRDRASRDWRSPSRRADPGGGPGRAARPRLP